MGIIQDSVAGVLGRGFKQMNADRMLRFRLATTADASGIAEIYAPIVASTAISFELDPPDAAEMARRIEETTRTHPWLVCVESERVAGYAYASRHRLRAAYQWSVEVSAYVHPEYRRKGIGRGLYISLFDVLAAQGFVNAYAGIALPNEASVRLHASVGFESIGVFRKIGFKFGKWHDVGWWQRNLRVYEDIAKPVNLPELFNDPSLVWLAVGRQIDET